jgi:succinate dehydrogenase / fumarate reductase iron-sulfur subunit
MTEFRILRYDPDKDSEPHFQTYTFDSPKGMTVLEGLIYLFENVDPTLSFRSMCRAAVCGSCAMHINGLYNLSCRTQIDKLGGKVTLRPLAHLPIIKDLVVDLDPFFEQYKKVMPYLIPKQEAPQKEYLQTEKDRKKLDPWVDCILCAACYGSCPVEATDPEYLGPAALMKALRFTPGMARPKRGWPLWPRTSGSFDATLSSTARRYAPRPLIPPRPSPS